MVAQWAQRYTTLYLQVVRELPPLTYTLPLGDPEVSTVNSEDFPTGEEGI